MSYIKHSLFSFAENDLNLFQSDIVLLDGEHTVTKRNARRSRKFLWQDKIVPYVISQELSKKLIIFCCDFSSDFIYNCT